MFATTKMLRSVAMATMPKIGRVVQMPAPVASVADVMMKEDLLQGKRKNVAMEEQKSSLVEAMLGDFMMPQRTVVEEVLVDDFTAEAKSASVVDMMMGDFFMPPTAVNMMDLEAKMEAAPAPAPATSFTLASMDDFFMPAQAVSVLDLEATEEPSMSLADAMMGDFFFPVQVAASEDIITEMLSEEFPAVGQKS
eukprot:TRINITY_DN4280_c0_g1_i1.p1 TRINITY_DN4280_c0_g1~~TRINITY_DN4280_c0_g1_i1.p1  ORF type:complete len:225 (+),score=71.62 TRINITY_DN4280_c0_g1_i1:94-675(+)